MSISRGRATIGVVCGIAVWPWLAACGGKAGPLLLGRHDLHDPCTLLSAAEAAPYVGPPGTPPYRASDGVPDPQGDQCVYRGRDGREITVEPDWTGAGAGRAAQDAPAALDTALNRSGASGLGAMGQRVMKKEPAGPWDEATWIPGGALMATKGDAMVNIDVSAASGKENDAVALAQIILPRFAHPLSYDGAKAVALVPKPPAHPASACDFVPRAAIEAAIGPLNGAPSSDAAETSCTYRVSTPEGVREYPVEFVWQNGQKNYAMLKHGMATTGEAMGLPSTSALDTLTPPPGMQKMMGGMMKMLGGASSEGKAPGAATTVGFRTDTTLVGPWDNASLLHGTQLIAVRHDVFVGMSLQSADYARAKALLAAICSRL
jgi:hypothetical protein